MYHLQPHANECLSAKDTYRRRQMQRTLTRQMSFDLTKLLVTEDWFCDISPQTMRRLLNIVSITGEELTMICLGTVHIITVIKPFFFFTSTSALKEFCFNEEYILLVSLNSNFNLTTKAWQT